MTPSRSWLTVVSVALAATALIAGPANAGPMDPVACPAGPGLTEFMIGGTGWKMCYPQYLPKQTDGIEGDPAFEDNILSFTKVFESMTPMLLTFVQIEAATENDTSEGLRIRVNEIVKNRSPNTWGGFQAILADLKPVCADPTKNNDAACIVSGTDKSLGSSTHPQFPHFHTASAGADTQFDGFTTVTGDRTTQMSLSNGTIAPGGQFNTKTVDGALKTFTLHTPDAQGFARAFTLTQRPIAEPGSLLLGSGLLAGLAAWSSRRKK